MHPARGEPLETRVEYAAVVSSVMMADSNVEDSELADLRNLCRELDLPEERIEEILAGGRAMAPEKLTERLRNLRGSKLRYLVLTDMVVLGHADGRYSMDERKRVRSFAMVMGVTEDQVVAIEKKVIDRTNEREQIKSMIEERAEEQAPWPLWARALPLLLASLVPVIVLLLVMPSATMDFFTINAGLANLGLGYGPVPGLGVVMLLAVTTWFIANWAVGVSLGRGAPER